MQTTESIISSVFSIDSDAKFNEVALQVFAYQYENNLVYRQFCDLVKVNSPKHYREIPFLPISFFKTHTVLSKEFDAENTLVFKSSGTTLKRRSQHFVADPSLYERSFLVTFKEQMIDPEDAIILALLPNYIQQGESSLVYMVDDLIRRTKHSLSGFYLDNYEELIDAVKQAKNEDKTIILFGVSYALLDLAERNLDFSGVKIIETGGMKGRRKELVKEELHALLKEGLNVSKIYSEYGMSELLSQAYSDGSEYFKTPQWMKILTRDINDPFQYTAENKTGGLNVIDLANIYSCSFIATDDLGIITGDRFKILGRFDHSDIRGCNLLVGE